MKKKTLDFSTQYRDPRWQKKRLEILQRRGFKCQHCKSETQQLHVHHCSYHNDSNIWDYEAHEYLVLCDKCHKHIHCLIDAVRVLCASLFMCNGNDTILTFESLMDNINGSIPPVRDQMIRSFQTLSFLISNATQEE